MTSSKIKRSNRTSRKRRYIRVKNLMREYPECAYNGDFYCDHVYDNDNPWRWVDFRFFHSTQKRYYAVAMTTLEFDEYEKDVETCHTIVDIELGQQRFGHRVKVFHPDYGDCYTFELSEDDRQFNDIYNTRLDEVRASVTSVARIVRPKIELKDYGDGVLGVLASVNKKFIDENVIREFIQFFRSHGEPTTPGWKWEGEEVEIIPARINDRA